MAPLFPAIPERIYRWASIVLTFHFVSLLWIFFRAETFEAATTLLGCLVQPVLLTAADKASLGYYALLTTAIVIGSGGVAHVLTWITTQRGGSRGPLYAWCRPFGWAVVAVAISLYASRGAQQFIYFQF